MTTIQILHASDLEGGLDAVANAPNFAAILEAFEAEAAADGIASVLLSAGDNYIPGPFFNAAQFIGDDVFVDVYSQLFAEDLAANPDIVLDVGDGRGNADIAIANILGFDASAIGNHEFDNGPDAFAGLIAPEVDGDTIESFGALFPYLSANLDFSGEPALADLAGDETLTVADYQSTPSELVAGASSPTRIGDAVITGEGEERIGILGATTQRVEQISSTGGVADATGGADDMEALAAVLQPQVDDLTEAGVDKVIIVSHLQDINLEQELAGLLSGVDVIVAGGSDTLLTDGTDRLREGDESGGAYPLIATGADDNPVALVSTAGEYSYLGRLVVEFDDDGVIVPGSIDAARSGNFAADEQGVLDVTGAEDLDAAIAASGKAGLVDTLTGAVQEQVTAADGTVFGETEVFLDGRRETVRTEEANLGNLTADANIAAARAVDPGVTVSIKNGGGIRAAIGEVDGETGELLPTQANPLSGKEEGEISELDIQNALRFDNELSLVTLSAEDLRIILEHGVSRSGPGSTPGQFPQVGGVIFSFDPEGTAQVLDDQGNVVTPGTRIQSVSLVDEAGQVTQTLVEDGEVVADAPSAIRTVTLNFLVGDEGDPVGGDGYPFRALGTNVVDTGIGEQQALQDFLAAEFPVDGDAAFDEAELAPSLDSRIQILDARSDSADAPAGRDELTLTLARVFQGESDPEDEDSPEGASEVVAHNDGRLYVTNGNLGRIDVFDIAGDSLVGSLDLEGFEGFAGVQSVAVGGGLVAAAIEIEATEADGEVIPANGILALYDEETLEFVTQVETGVLPDAITWDGVNRQFLVAIEGEFNSESDLTVDAPGGVTAVDVSDPENIASTTTTFTEQDVLGSGVRLSPDAEPALDLEPEFITVAPDGSRAYVSVQEANAIAVLNTRTLEFIDLYSLGRQDFSEVPVDITDNDVIDIETRPVQGLRQPDAIKAFEINGGTFFATANEGDGRGDAFAEVEEDVVTATLPMEEAQEVGTDVPDTAATGGFAATLDREAMTITVEGTFSELSAPLFPVGGEDGAGNAQTAVHIHLGEAGENGPIFRNLTVEAEEDGLSGSFGGTFEVTEEQAEVFVEDGYYVNLHTEAFNGGELRGQIDLPEASGFERVPFGDEARGSELAAAGVLDPTAFPTEVAASALPMAEAQEVGADVPDTAATGSFDAALDEAAMTISVTGSFEDLSAPLFPVGGEDGAGNPESPIHIHLGNAGENGPIFRNLTVEAAADGLSGTFAGTFEVTEEQAATFREDGYYVNLHTEAFQGGELRGQIDLPETTTFSDVAEGDLSRLIYSAIDGDTDGDGDIDELVTFGARSFSIFNANGEVIFDSGSDFEEIIANIAPERFLDDDGELGQNRADAKGVEPEAIEIGVIGQQTYAFIGLERDNGLMVYNVSDPFNSQFVTYVDGFETGNIGPEIIEFISAEESTSGSAQLAVSYEVSGTTAVYDLARLESDALAESYYEVALGRDADLGGYDFWSDLLEFGDTEDLVAEAFADSDEFEALTADLDPEATVDFLFGNALGREATDEEQAAVAEEAEAGEFGQLIFDLVNDDALV